MNSVICRIKRSIFLNLLENQQEFMSQYADQPTHIGISKSSSVAAINNSIADHSWLTSLAQKITSDSSKKTREAHNTQSSVHEELSASSTSLSSNRNGLWTNENDWNGHERIHTIKAWPTRCTARQKFIVGDARDGAPSSCRCWWCHHDAVEPSESSPATRNNCDSAIQTEADPNSCCTAAGKYADVNCGPDDDTRNLCAPASPENVDRETPSKNSSQLLPKYNPLDSIMSDSGIFETLEKSQVSDNDSDNQTVVPLVISESNTASSTRQAQQTCFEESKSDLQELVVMSSLHETRTKPLKSKLSLPVRLQSISEQISLQFDRLQLIYHKMAEIRMQTTLSKNFKALKRLMDFEEQTVIEENSQDSLVKLYS